MHRTAHSVDITALATMSSPSTTPSATDFAFDFPTLPMADSPRISLRLTDLPDEVLTHILFHLEPEETLLSVQLVSRRIYTLVQEPLLWRHHCRANFHYWDERHEIQRRFKAEIEETDWLELFLERRHADVTTTQLLDRILSEQIGRIDKTNQIGEFGYDAKDTLLRHCRADPNAPDVLARKFHSTAVLDHIHRATVLKEWQSLDMQRAGRHSNVTPERALGCFDMFILHEHFGDLEEISDIIDGLKKKLLAWYPDFRYYGLRQKASTVAQFLRDNNLTGLENEERFKDLQNSFISAALLDPKHPSVPLISVAIYCSLACRLGLDASFVNFPRHVHAIVTIEDDEHIYFDPYKSAEEVPRAKLISILNEEEVAPELHRVWLVPANLQSMVSRSARNILLSIRDQSDPRPDDWINVRNKGFGNPFADQGDAVYAGYWALFMMSNSPEDGQLFIPALLRLYEEKYLNDGNLIEKYICNRPGYVEQEERDDFVALVRLVRTSDSIPKTPKRRDGSGFTDNVRYKVGQVFRHKRERYIAVIAGWDEQCRMQNTWIRQQGVDQLQRGRFQSFYHALVEDNSSRYVAEDNIEIIEPEVPETLLGLAGKHFKRWDKESHTFVSNVEDEYPDN